jgi:predicted amino acid dehydrogenase
MKHIISISLGSSQRDYSCIVTILGQRMTIERIGTNGSITEATHLIQQHEGRVDAIGLDGLTPVYHVGSTRYPHPQALRIAAHAWRTPIADGSMLRATLERWAIRRTADQVPDIFRHRRILVTSGIQRYPLADVLSQYSTDLRFADPLLIPGPAVLPPLRSLKQLERFAATVLPFTTLLPPQMLPTQLPDTPRRSAYARRLFAWANVIAGDCATLLRFAPPELRGRTIVTDDPSPAEIAALRERQVATLVTMTPPLSDEHPFVAPDVLEAIVTVMTGNQLVPNEASVLDFISAAKWEPTIQQLTDLQSKPKFAFVVHPLNPRHIASVPGFQFTRYLPGRLVERVAAYAPPLYISRMRGICSQATGQEIEGILLCLGGTPRELLRRPPEFTYRRLVAAARMADRMGARIMGLGAFTSVVGDAGVTVAQQSDIGITTGNALTVAATLEAAKQAALMLGARIDQGRAVVIGATGSIGAVCARLLALAIGDVVLIAPRAERLLLLKQQIEHETPGVRVIAATHPDLYIGNADLIVTTTSALKGNVLDIAKLKPGAVVCDVARPANVSKAEADRRPDVLVIESGEIRLPGHPDFGVDIGLPPGTAYACLAETALLTMEGRFEDYTLGRNIEIERAKEMYRLMKKHGLQLAGLRSFGRYITEEDLAQKRRLIQERHVRAGNSTEVLV